MKIVLVAEMGFTRSSILVNLHGSGDTVVEAEPTCLLDVLEVVREVLPQLVIVDSEIPRCNSETLVRILREDPILGGLPILLLSEPWSSAAAERMGHWRKVCLVQKPLQVEVLLQAVEAQRLVAGAV